MGLLIDKHPVDDFDFSEFTATVGALIMGRDTYKTALEFGWIWEDMPTLVLTHQTSLTVPEGATVKFVAQPTPEVIRSFSACTPKRLWVLGGAKVIADCLKGGASTGSTSWSFPKLSEKESPCSPRLTQVR